MKIYSLKTVPLPAHHAERDGYFERAMLAFLLLCSTPLQCLFADEVPNHKRPQQPPIQSEEVPAARSPDLEAMRADLKELRRTAYDPRDKAILDLEKKIAAAEEMLVGTPKDATKPTEHLVRIISDPGFSELHRGLLKRDEKASLVVEFHGERAVGLATPIRIVDVNYGVRATEYTLAVNDSQLVAIQKAYAMSPYWFSLWPFKDDHVETFAQAESLADVQKAHPEWSPKSEEQWGWGAVRESGRAQPPERKSLPTSIVVTAESSGTDRKAESLRNVPEELGPDRFPENTMRAPPLTGELPDKAAYSLVPQPFEAESELDSSPPGNPEVFSADRATLKRRLEELRVEVERNEDACVTVATAFRDLRIKAEVVPGRKNELHAELQEAVQTAFESRWQLQDVRLKLTAADLKTLQEKHQHRKGLAEKIIERRVEQLKNGDELSWTQAATETKVSNLSPEPAAIPQTDSELEGDWKLISAPEADLLTLKPNTRLRIMEGKWTLTYSGQKREMLFQLNTSTAPRQIDLRGLSSLQNNIEGIYQLEDNLLTIACAAGVASRPTDFASPGLNIQVWKRVEPIPKFETPKQLLEFLTEASNPNSPDFEDYMQLYTDDEATRFAGMLAASMGMMNRVMPLIMMSNAMGADDNPPVDMTSMTRVSALLRDAVSPTAAPQCVQAFHELTKSDLSFLGSSASVKVTDPDVFSEKLKLAGGAVGDPRSFAAQLMMIMKDMDAAPDDSSDNGEKPEWVVTRSGDTAVAVKQSKDEEGESSKETLELIRHGDTWKISSAIDRKTLAEMAPVMTGGMVGTDSEGNEVPLNSIFAEMSGGMEPVFADKPKPLTLKQALEQQQFTGMDLETWFTPTSMPFRFSPPTPRDQFPEWLPQYIDGAHDLLKGAWQEREYRLLRSLDPAIHFAKDTDDWGLTEIGKRVEAHVREHSNAKTSVAFSSTDSPWSAAMLSRIARTLGKLPDEVYAAKHPDQNVRKRLELLTTMLQNKANRTWIDQEQIRLSGLLLEAPVETLRLIFRADSGENLEELKRWLFAVSKPEFYASLTQHGPAGSGSGPPIDPVLMIVLLEKFSGSSEATDTQIGFVLEAGADVGLGARTRETGFLHGHLHDILSSDLAYRQFVFDALVSMYRNSKSDSLKLRLAMVSPAIPVHARYSVEGQNAENSGVQGD